MDPYGTAALRERVLAAWSASAARFREDANAEEDLARGGYRDRVVVELAQNAADAAARAGAPGRLALRLRGDVLTASNTGAPLDPAGVEGLSTLRASAKRDDVGGTVGRFGVGFAAVLAVSDEPVVRSRDGAVRWSLREATELAVGLPGLAEEVTRRAEAVPVLRLPFPADPVAPPAPFTTEVVLPLRDGGARALVAELLGAVDDALLITLPALVEVEVEVDGRTRVLRVEERTDLRVAVREGDRLTSWRLVSRSGTAPPAALADRPVEERARPGWAVTVAVPVDRAGAPLPLPPSLPRVVHAPTATDEATALPVLAVAGLPLDPTRRHVAPGALTDLLVGELAAAYADLVAGLASAGPGVLGLVPGPLGAGALDSRLHEAVRSALAAAAWLPAADGSGALRPRDAVLVDGARSAADPGALGSVVAGLPDPDWWRPDVLRRLGTRELRLADLVDDLAGLALAPRRWRELYAALDGADREALAGLPVPLADGRVVRGARGLLLPAGPLPEGLDVLRLRLVHPEAAHPLLERLGAVEATADALLDAPAVGAAVQEWERDDLIDPAALSEAVLGLVQAAGGRPEAPEAEGTGGRAWLADTPLRDAAGAWARAGDLLVPGSPLVDVLDAREDEVVGTEAVQRWGTAVLARVGVRTGFALLRPEGLALEPEGLPEVDDADGWLDAVLDRLPPQDVPPVAPEPAFVRDLDLVRENAWPRALELLAAEPETRRALVAPTRVLTADGGVHDVPAYASWWVREHARVGGRRLADCCAADAEPLVRALLDPVPLPVDTALLAALGLPRTVDDLLDDPVRLLDLLGDPGRPLAARDLAVIVGRLAAVDPDEVDPPERVRVPEGPGTRVVAAGEVVVATSPQWLQLPTGPWHLLPGPVGVAEVLDLPTAEEELAHEVAAAGAAAEVPAVVLDVVPGAPRTYVEHDELRVGGHEVAWWVDEAGAVHAATVDGLARGLAWVAGSWADRLLLAELLRDPEQAPVLLAERGW